MAMPWPTPVVPSRSRSSSTSKMARSCWPVNSAAFRASSCRACFLLPALRFGRMLSGVIRSIMASVLRRPLSGAGSLGVLGIDPADMAVVTAIDHVQAAMGAVAEHQSRQFGKVEAQHGLADRQGLDRSRHLGDDHRLSLVGAVRGVAVGAG